MRITISGSAGTGKTTLGKELSLKLNVPLIEEGVREYLEEKNITNFRSMSPRDTMDMQWEILNRKIEKENKLNNFVADRCVADNVAYTVHQIFSAGDPGL